MGKSHGSQTSQRHVRSVNTFANAFIDHVANSFVFEEIAGRVGNGTVAWQCIREILLLSLVSCCVHFFFFLMKTACGF